MNDNVKVELPLLKGSDREKCIPAAVIVGLIIMVIIFFIACLSLTIKAEYTLHYSENSNLDYKVYLKENNYYEEEYLGKDRQYISTLIDYIDASFDYTFKADENIGLEYTYYVTASVLINNSEGKNIYEKVETITDRTNVDNLNGDTFNVKENVKISYDRYNNLAQNFIDEYNITADSKLVVSLYVDISGKHADFDRSFNDKAVISLVIPLTSKTIDVEMDYDLTNSVDQVLQYRETAIKNRGLFTFSIILAIIDVVAIIAVIVWIIKNRDKQTLYNKKLNKILRDYDRYISETVITERVEDMMKTRSLRIELIKTFEGLIDIRDNLGKPILFHEERPGEEAIFYIITDRVGYIYVMRKDDFDKKKK